MGPPYLAGQDAACKDRQVDCETSQWRLLVRMVSREVRDMAKEDTRLSMEERESRATSVRTERFFCTNFDIYCLDQP